LAESIGERIKSLRTQQGMTLAELGERTNLSTSYLSQIERDKTSPSLSTLETIAKALNIGLRYLFETDDEVAFIVRSSNGTGAVRHKSPIERQPLMPQVGNPEIEVYRITFDPCSPLEQIERFAGEEVIYVLSGEFTILIGDELFILKAGDSIHYDAILLHSWRNESDEPCAIIWGRARALSDYQSSSNTRVWNTISEKDGI
jgi:transcriptional regulator with XRE-family HTH domain/uncharacterized RmlC-like cupin family protein